MIGVISVNKGWAEDNPGCVNNSPGSDRASSENNKAEGGNGFMLYSRYIRYEHISTYDSFDLLAIGSRVIPAGMGLELRSRALT